MKRSLPIAMALLSLVLVQHSSANDIVPPLRQRFEAADAQEVPDFQKHVAPLMGRLGCNGRACHGSFQGAGGLQFSLFGYDFKMDHQNLLDRIDTEDAAASYALEKATAVEPHEGGQRMTVGSWEYNVFLKWIEGGAKSIGEKPLDLIRLEVTPAEIVFSGKDQTRQLKAVAIWADGTQEDVTPLCRFTSNDDVIAQIDGDGMVTSGDVGDAHVVVAYDNKVVPVEVIQPVSDKVGDKYPQVATTTRIDELVVDKLSKLGVIPSEVCSDAEFLRRISLDLAGTLPSAQEVRAFLADSSPDKRARKVDELLKTPAYAAWWTTRLCDWTGCSDQQLNNINPANRQKGSQDWYTWINRRITDNVPYDKICEDIIVASSRLPGEDYREYCERMSAYAHDKNASFADQPGLVYFWGRQNFRTSEDRAIGFAYTFMGTRIQCAQCHKHPFDVWTKNDFEQFMTFFDRVNFARQGTDRDAYRAIIKELGVEDLKGNDQRKELQKAVEKGKTIPFPELVIQEPRLSNAERRKQQQAKKEGKKYVPEGKTARLLGEQEVDLKNIEDPRVALMDWLRNSPTKLFAKAFVNRVWANYFNVGIVDPTDDLSLGNPPSNKALLNYLTDGFIDSGYDMQWLHREICLSDTYQRSWQPNETNIHDERNFSRAVPRRLPAEVAYDALLMATSNDKRAETFLSNLKDRGLTRTSPPRNAANGPDYALAVFGRSVRESNCDCDRSSEASLLQTLFVRNDKDTLTMLERRDGWVAQWSGSSKGGENTEEARKRAVAEQRLERLQVALKKAQKQGEKKRIATLEQQLERAEEQLQPFIKAAPKELAIDAQQVIEDAYLRTLSRFPNDQEKQLASAYITGSEDAQTGLRDLMWALINTKEFMVNH